MAALMYCWQELQWVHDSAAVLLEIFRSSIVVPLNAVMAMAVSCRFSSRFWATTITSYSIFWAVAGRLTDAASVAAARTVLWEALSRR
jgi:hypothetical protein